MIEGLLRQYFSFITTEIMQHIRTIPQEEQEKIAQKIQSAKNKTIILNTIATESLTNPSNHIETLDFMIEILKETMAKSELNRIQRQIHPIKVVLTTRLSQVSSLHMELLKIAMEKQDKNVTLFIINNYTSLSELQISITEKYKRIENTVQL